MSGRRSHILNNLKNEDPKSKPGGKRKLGRGLDALTLAEREFPQDSGIKRHRLGHVEDDYDSRPKRRLDEDASSDEDAPSKKRRTGDSDEDRGSDSEGNEWVVGRVDSEDDSDIDSEDALGSDEERFEGFAFRASSTRKGGKKAVKSKSKKDDSLSEEGSHNDGDAMEEELDDDFGDDAVDLATALDMNIAESDEERQKARSKTQKQNNHIDDSESDTSGSDMDSEEEESEGESELSLTDDDDAVNTRGLSRLQKFVSNLQSESEDRKGSIQGPSITLQGREPTEFGLISSRKLTVDDLLPTISDSRMKGSLKHLHADAATKKTKSGGIPGKLDAPLSKREQDRLNRAAAFQKSKETLERWVDTVKENRRADHISFPLPEIAPLQDAKISDSKPRTDLETTIQKILAESGLANSDGKDAEDRIQEFEELQTKKISLNELQERRNELRKARELLFREEVRAKRIKKIKSKSYRRVHRKEREKMEQQEHDALAAAGVELDDDRERADRLRAEMRMGAKHRESKWAKSVKQTGRATWDEDARAGIEEQARRKEELQRRIEGKRIENEDYSDSSSSESEENDFDPFDNIGSDDEAEKLKRRLNELEGGGVGDEALNGPHAKLLSMKFMRNAEASRKAANEAEIKKLNRQLAGENSASEMTDEEGGRQRFGNSGSRPTEAGRSAPVSLQEFEEHGSDSENPNLPGVHDEVDIHVSHGKEKGSNRATRVSRVSGNRALAQGPAKDVDANPWLSEATRKPRKKKGLVDNSMDITLVDNTSIANAPGQSKQKASGERKRTSQPHNDSNHNDGESDDDVPVLLQNEDLVQRAFAGDEVLEAFTKEKLDVVEEEGDQVLEDTLPGWGSWAGSGLTKKEKRDASSKRTFKTVEGIKPSNRKDAKLDRVIINEKRIRKNNKYLASQLPHPFESRQQYERSLRLPIGPEWATKEVFQDSTKPRVMVKQGVIKPIQRPHM